MPTAAILRNPLGTTPDRTRSQYAEAGIALPEDGPNQMLWRHRQRPLAALFVEARRRSGLSIDELNALLGLKATSRSYRTITTGEQQGFTKPVDHVDGWAAFEQGLRSSKYGCMSKSDAAKIFGRVLGGDWQVSRVGGWAWSFSR